MFHDNDENNLYMNELFGNVLAKSPTITLYFDSSINFTSKNKIPERIKVYCNK